MVLLTCLWSDYTVLSYRSAGTWHVSCDSLINRRYRDLERFLKSAFDVEFDSCSYGASLDVTKQLCRAQEWFVCLVTLMMWWWRKYFYSRAIRSVKSAFTLKCHSDSIGPFHLFIDPPNGYFYGTTRREWLEIEWGCKTSDTSSMGNLKSGFCLFSRVVWSGTACVSIRHLACCLERCIRNISWRM